MDIILLIDDDDEIRLEKVEAINDCIKKQNITEEVCVQEITAKELDEIANAEIKEDYPSIEDKFAKYLIDRPEIKLVVVDKDLSKYDAAIQSESTVTEGACIAAVPVCGYSRRLERDHTSSLTRLKQWNMSNIIAVDKNTVGENAVELYMGFKAIEDRYPKIDDRKVTNSELLGMILDKNEQKSYFENYEHNISMPGSIFEISVSEKKRRIYFLGLWLYKYILRFPGVIFNKSAAAAYLNISEEDFEANSALFKEHQYLGPFSVYTKYWWRYEIEDLLNNAEAEDGADYIYRETNKRIEKNDDEGKTYFYCMLTKKPISERDSDPARQIIPLGADLAKIDKDKLEVHWEMTT
ncbi:MAG: hypothetical protein HUJ16_10420 [Kangiella sp.]|nr:hypothetical protein [Kangiella sp.]